MEIPDGLLSFLYGAFWLAVLAGIAVAVYYLRLAPRTPRRTAPANGAPHLDTRTAPEPPATTRGAAAHEPRTNAEIIAAAGLADFRPGGAADPAAASAGGGAGLRFDTDRALSALPDQAPLPPIFDTGSLPLLWDGTRWHNLRLDGGHWGIFGSTGSGKGNALQYIALNVLRLGPDRAHLVVLDPKGGLDYAFCNRLQHAQLYHGASAEFGLTAGYKHIVELMTVRHEDMLAVEARNLAEYIARTGNQAPLVFVIADEVAELDKDQRAMLGTIARMGRAAGIVLLVATQYPTVEALSNQVQANLANRLVLRLESSSYTPVALRRTKEDGGQYEPAAINRPGVGVLRRDGGREVLGVVPEVDDVTRNNQITVLALQWGVAMSSVSAPEARVVADDEPDNEAMLRRLLAGVGGTGTDDGDGSQNAEIPTAEPVRTGSDVRDLAHSDAQEPVRTDLPQDEQSRAIRALVQVGFSRNKIIDLLSLPGNKAAGLKRIKQALGEEND